MEGPDGNLYGTTISGGKGNFGVLYRVSKQGANFQVLKSFCSTTNCRDGGAADNVLVAASDGNIYGTTGFGGSGGCQAYNILGCGTIFRVTPATGQYQIVFSFGVGSASGDAFPGALTVGADGLLYGFAGNMFKFDPATAAFTNITVHFLPSPSGLPAHAGNLVLGPN